MAVAYVQQFEPGGNRTTTNYDAISKLVAIEDDPPAGLIHHSVGFADDGTFRNYDVWESHQDVERFMDERLTPAVEQVMSSHESASPPPPPRQQVYELHDVFAGG